VVPTDPLYILSTGVPLTATDVVIYLSNGTTTLATTTGLATLGSPTLPFAAQVAFDITPAAGGTVQAYTFASGAWSASVSLTTAATASVTPGNYELSITPTSDISATGTVDVLGTVIVAGGLNSWWPQFNGALGYVSDGLNSCVTPSASVK